MVFDEAFLHDLLELFLYSKIINIYQFVYSKFFTFEPFQLPFIM